MIALQQELRRRVILAGDPSGADLVGGADTSSIFSPRFHKHIGAGNWFEATPPTPPSIEGGENAPRTSIEGGEKTPRPSIEGGEKTPRPSIEGGEKTPRPLIEGGEKSIETIYAAIVVWSRSLGKVVAKATAAVPATFPYVPGLLAFREMPALMAAWEKLEFKPEAIIVDGQGIAHPRRCGIACHFGLEVGLPTVGCGKTRLIGKYEEPGEEKGEWEELKVEVEVKVEREEEIIGRVVRTRKGVLPVFVSPGHMCDIEGAMKLLLACCTRYRLPEPIREAHRAAGEARRNQ